MALYFIRSYGGVSLQPGTGTVCPRLSAQSAMDQLARSSLGVQEPRGSHGSILQTLYLLVWVVKA